MKIGRNPTQKGGAGLEPPFNYHLSGVNSLLVLDSLRDDPMVSSPENQGNGPTKSRDLP